MFVAQRLRAAHRLAGLVLVVPLVLWIGTGPLFHVKPGWDETGEVSQTGDLNGRIDRLYRIHYLQWTSWKPVNVELVLAASLLVSFLAAPGVRLAFKGPSRDPNGNGAPAP